jgi:hypothetical protein
VGGKVRLIWENLTFRRNISHLSSELNYKPNKRLAEADGNVSLPSTSAGVFPLIWLPHIEEAEALLTHQGTCPWGGSHQLPPPHLTSVNLHFLPYHLKSYNLTSLHLTTVFQFTSPQVTSTHFSSSYFNLLHPTLRHFKSLRTNLRHPKSHKLASRNLTSFKVT